MRGTASTSVTVGLGIGEGGDEVAYGSFRYYPFTSIQRQELEHQAMIYKYLVAGLPVPPDLILPIRHSFEALSARLFHHPSLGYCSYYGKKFDPEPGRCRRTDGKKWRCSKDAHPDSKYCERHMHRGRNRSRKPVESQNNSSQSIPTALPHVSGGSNITGNFQNMPLYSVMGTQSSPYGSSVAKLQMEPVSYGINHKEFRYNNNIQGLTLDPDDQGFSSEASALGLSCNSGDATWRLMPTQVSSSSLLKEKPDTQFLGSSSAPRNIAHAFEPMSAAISRQQEQHAVHPFFSEWPMNKESWSTLDDDDDGSNKNVFSSTQLSISIPRASSDFTLRGGNSPKW
ncbi:Growth-regulating factor 5 [Striga hermonthica]|uniref:Growth-regulating factor n=1 Tax=Striga hermonthica TaxID=68872 RepID=A0A9N7N2W5_STRHE|nr:Growth-regulating factor 5 [Striga hermonthica]